MKTNELIKLLQEADPSGQSHVYIPWSGMPRYVINEPAYYDGNLHIIEGDKFKVTQSGRKVLIHCSDLENYISNLYPIEWEQLKSKFEFELLSLIEKNNICAKESFLNLAKRLYDKICLDDKILNIKSKDYPKIYELFLISFYKIKDKFF